MNIAVITPIKHLSGISDILINKGSLFYLEDGSKRETRNLLLKHDIDVILCNPNKQDFIIDKNLLKGTKVKIINTCSTGLNHIDTDYCDKNNIEILSLKEDMELINDLPSTSELAFGLMMCLTRKITQGMQHVMDGGWDYTSFVGRQIKDLTIGIVGYGRLGKMMHNFCSAFNAKCIIYDPHVVNIGCDSLSDLVSKSDVISLHVHVTDETKYMFNKELLGKLKKNSYIINTSRGEIVDERAIVKSLDSGNLAGYATDVIENEFDNINNSPIVKAMRQGKNVIVTPHVGGMTYEGQQKAYEWAVKKL